jgi:hypothetical protein
VVYTIPEIKVLLRSQPDDAERWLTTSQMGWTLTRKRNKITNEKDERDGKPVARQPAPMISKFIKVQFARVGASHHGCLFIASFPTQAHCASVFLAGLGHNAAAVRRQMVGICGLV